MTDQTTSASRVPIGDGWSTDDRATASCYCGTVQIEFPLNKPDFVFAFICNCTDCRKITASMFATNIVVKQAATKYIRGEDNLSTYSRSDTILSGETMTNKFCQTCGTLMWRQSAAREDEMVMRLGTVDDFHLHETKLRPSVEIFCKDRVGWCSGGEKGGIHGVPLMPEGY